MSWFREPADYRGPFVRLGGVVGLESKDGRPVFAESLVARDAWNGELPAGERPFVPRPCPLPPVRGFKGRGTRGARLRASNIAKYHAARPWELLEYAAILGPDCAELAGERLVHDSRIRQALEDALKK